MFSFKLLFCIERVTGTRCAASRSVGDMTPCSSLPSVNDTNTIWHHISAHSFTSQHARGWQGLRHAGKVDLLHKVRPHVFSQADAVPGANEDKRWRWLMNEQFNLQSSREHPDCKHDAGPWQKLQQIHRTGEKGTNARLGSVSNEKCLLLTTHAYISLNYSRNLTKLTSLSLCFRVCSQCALCFRTLIGCAIKQVGWICSNREL